MDYSKFVDAVLQQDDATMNEQAKVITPVLIKFLMVRMNASVHDAKDCAQNTLLVAIEKIRQGDVNHPDALINYMFTTARNEYLNEFSSSRELNYDDPPEHHSNPADQLNKLVDKEKMKLLKHCIDSLKADYKKYIQYWFQHPGYETSVVAEHFGITVNNAWTKKHRVINAIKKCLDKKI
jgi:RNA polymerase sigma factor (sigma-70 family)